MKCNRCEKDANLGVNDEPLCYDCALEEGLDDIVREARARDKARASKCERCDNAAVVEVNDVALCHDCAVVRVHELTSDEELDDLRARVAVLEERERKCATVDEAEKRALIRGLQEIAAVIGGTDELSPADIVQQVTAIVARGAELEDALLSEIEAWKDACGIMRGDDPSEITPEHAEEYWLGVEEERDQLRARVADLEAEVDQLQGCAWAESTNAALARNARDRMITARGAYEKAANDAKYRYIVARQECNELEDSNASLRAATVGAWRDGYAAGRQDQSKAGQAERDQLRDRVAELEAELREAVKAGDWARSEATDAKCHLAVTKQHLRERSQPKIMDLWEDEP